jgi:ubiquinone/menaquinone biosynthesis C-methylase UbiE
MPSDNARIFQDYEGKDYEGFWTGVGKRYLDRLEQRIISEVLIGGDAILDIGAGFGRLGPCYISKFRSAHMLEPASNLREAAQRTFGAAVQCHAGNVYELPFPDGAFDAALMIRVFHHLGNPDVALNEVCRVLKPGGMLVFSYSNKRNIARIVRFLVGRGSNPFRGDCEPYQETLFGHHPRYIDKLLNAAGFMNVAEYATGLADKVVNMAPFLQHLVRPSVRAAKLVGRLRIAPAQIVVGVRR